MRRLKKRAVQLRTVLMTAALLAVLLLAGCAGKTRVLKQKVPVSTNPVGAQVYADGEVACTTPCSVQLERNSDHLLTLVKPGYAQVDVEVLRKYRGEAMFDVVREGLKGGLDSPGATIDDGMDKAEEQKQTGEAYELHPKIVRVRLWEEGSQPPPDEITMPRDGVYTAPRQQPSPISMLRAPDVRRLYATLEQSPSGVPTSWSNPQTGVRFTVVPEPGRGNSRVVRWFTIKAVGPQGTLQDRMVATRYGYGDWRIGVNAP